MHLAVLPFLWHPLGACPHGPTYEACRSYNLWSGILGSFLVSTPGWLVAFMLYTRRHNCHAKGCWRLGRHPVEGTTYVVCRRHHPEGKPTAEEIHGRWRRGRWPPSEP